jgi:hypothetical protein
MASKTERERIAIDLKKWLRSQGQYRRVKDLQAPTGIPYESLKDYFQGRSIPSGERLERLAALTALPTLNALLPIRSERVTKAGESSKEMAQAVLTTIHRLLNELNFFKRGTAADRAAFRRIVPPRDVGYLMTLLKAMFDEDQFQEWLYFAEYNPESR